MPANAQRLQSFPAKIVNLTEGAAAAGTIASPRVTVATGMLADTVTLLTTAIRFKMQRAGTLVKASYSMGGTDGATAASGTTTIVLYNVTTSTLVGWVAIAASQNLKNTTTAAFTISPVSTVAPLGNPAVAVGDILTIYYATGTSATLPIGELDMEFRDTDATENPAYPNTGIGINGYPPVA